VATALAICRGTVLQVTAFRDPRNRAIKTETLVHVDETLKGRFPEVVRLVHDGGTIDGEGQQDGFSPRLRPGERRLFLLGRRADGCLGAVDGFASAIPLTADSSDADPLVAQVRALRSKETVEADVTDQAAAWSGAIPARPSIVQNTTGLLLPDPPLPQVPSRFLLPDRGEPIEYFVDAETLPAGLTLNQCLEAATNAFAAWTAVTGIQFRYIGLTNYLQASATVSATDLRIRIQFHDLYHYIPSDSTLGKGGRGYTYLLSLQNGGQGGKVIDQEFYASNHGYVVLNHRAGSMGTLKTFEEVLCHEIGHSLGMAHSSEVFPESNTVLREAMMYYQAHADGRGATLGQYDPPIMQKIHPLSNTPPYGYDRVMDVVTASPQPNVAGINSVQIEGFDKQHDPLTYSLGNNAVPGNGSFALAGSLLKYIPAQAWSDSGRDDPADIYYRDSILVRLSDGVNASPYIRVRVVSFNQDSQPPNASDGIPDWWANLHFNSAIPSAPAKTRAQDDWDGDGLTNLEEWLAGTDPAVAGSALAISGFDGSTIEFAARPYEVYEVVGSTDFGAWTREGNPLLPTTTIAIANAFDRAAGSKFFQVRRVP